MNMQPVEMREGQSLLCCGCKRMRSGPIFADLDGQPFVAFFCGACTPCPRTLAIYKPGQAFPGVSHSFAYTGSIPNTGQLRCTLCGVIQS